MMKRFFGWGVVAVVGFGILSLQELSRRSAHAQGFPIAKPLNPAGSFAIRSDPGLKLNRIGAGGGLLWSILYGPNYLQVLATDSMGSPRASFVLPSPSPGLVLDACMNQDQLAVFHHGGTLEVYSSSGTRTHTLNPGPATQGCAFVDNVGWVVQADRVFRFGTDPDSGLATPNPLLWPILVLSLKDHRLGIIETGEAMLNVLDTAVGTWQRFQLMAPEIQGIVRAPRAKDQVVPAVFAAAVDEATGDIYAGISPINMGQGMNILKFDGQGVLTGRFQCRLPRSPTAKDRNGYFVVAQMAVLDGKLTLVSTKQQVVYFDAN